ncbi:hypothetical protein FZC79_04210 [Rossellomorea vietnamensis]|uniref:Uncharacterized protein n=1 Tax=Rossellomorea vietnamensis TaxID=218284 RepID=A0A5D4KIW5_9BACI|nr:hypothetical protein FZC79_04210 [Rossellomorea vietnamensis]
MRATSCGTSGTGETPQAKPRRLTARPAESCGWSGNPSLFHSHNLYENSLLIIREKFPYSLTKGAPIYN